jgi:hypothetical protein
MTKYFLKNDSTKPRIPSWCWATNWSARIKKKDLIHGKLYSGKPSSIQKENQNETQQERTASKREQLAREKEVLP